MARIGAAVGARALSAVDRVADGRGATSGVVDRARDTARAAAVMVEGIMPAVLVVMELKVVPVATAGTRRVRARDAWRSASPGARRRCALRPRLLVNCREP